MAVNCKKENCHLYLIVFFILMVDLVTSTAQTNIDHSNWILKRDSGVLQGTLSTPVDHPKNVAILFISGSGPTDRDGNNPFMKNNSLKGLSDSLVLNGYTTLRFDKRGIGESSSGNLDEASLIFDDFVSDAVGWLSMLKDSFPNYKHVIAGHSQGSLVGILTARKEQTEGLISLAGTGRPIDQVIHDQLENQMPNLVGMSDSISALIKSGRTVENIPPMLASLYRPSVQPFLRSYMNYNPAAEAAKLKIPILIVQGQKDLQVTVKDANLLHTASQSSTLKLIPAMNHVLKDIRNGPIQNQESYNNPDLPISNDLLHVVKSFLKKIEFH